MAFVSNETSEGNNSLTGSSISQTFTVPVGTTSLTFDVNLLNNDDDSANFGPFDDFGGVAISQGSTILAEFDLDLACNGTGGCVVADTSMGGFLNNSGWFSPSLSLLGLDGQDVTVTAYSTNYGGDNSVETRLLAD